VDRRLPFGVGQSRSRRAHGRFDDAGFRIDGNIGRVDPNFYDWIGGHQPPDADSTPLPPWLASDVTDPAALRQMVGDMERERLRKVISSVVDQATNAEMCDSIYLTVFPDFHPLGSFTRIVYRVRPFVDDPNLYVHEGQPRPPTIPVEP